MSHIMCMLSINAVHRSNVGPAVLLAARGHWFFRKGLRFTWAAPSQIFGLKAGLFGDLREDCWAEFLGIVKRKWVVRPSFFFMILWEPTVRPWRRPIRFGAAQTRRAFAEG